MDVNAPRWDEYEAAFTAVANEATPWTEPTKPDLVALPLYLCLYGNNGMSVEEEFATLATLQTALDAGNLYCLEIEADYWYERILFTL
jgi:hypothetical protein